MNQKKIQKPYFLLPSAIVLLLLLGSTALFLPLSRQWLKSKVFQERVDKQKDNNSEKVLSLISFSPQQRQSELKAIAKNSKSDSRSRALYLLAQDAKEQQKPQLALKYLQNLDKDYPILAAPILLQRGLAYRSLDRNEEAIFTWETLIKNHPNSPMVAEAVYLLGKFDPQYWQSYQDKILQFPNHPRTQETIRQLLEKNPARLDLLIVLAKSDPRDNLTRDRLIADFSNKLTPENWQAIADGYWQQGKYRKAAETYINADHNGRNAYRIARGLHLIRENTQAKKLYQSYIKEFPNNRETALALKHLASLSNNQESLKYLDLLSEKFPEKAAKTTLEKARRSERLKEKNPAKKIRQSLLTKYPNSQAAADYRWKKAQKFAADRDLKKAIQTAKEIVSQNSESYLVPQASFWIGKWSQKLGDREESKTAFEYVLNNHPQSYYAWRSAVLLGWEVDSFTTTIYGNPTLDKPITRSLPPAGSDTFKELYLLGQDRDAWNYFLVEIKSKPELSVKEKFTEGLLNVAKGNYQLGTYQIWSLQNQEDPQQKQEWQSLRKTPQYWQTLFPIAYKKIISNWSQKRQINPVLITSLIRRESRFQTSVKSVAGATGLMQLMPTTGAWVANKIGLKNYSLANPDDNVNLGTKYLKHIHQLYDNNSLLAIASYNAGPANVNKWINRYGFEDPDVFVETIPFPETKNYVKAVFGGYWNYLRIYNPEIARLLSERSSVANNKKKTPAIAKAKARDF